MAKATEMPPVMSAQQQFGAAVLILGESHANAIARAIKAADETDFVAIDVRNRSSAASGGKIDFDSFAGYRPRHLVLAFGGTENNLVGLIETDPPFDLVCPPYENIKDGRTLVPFAAIEEILSRRLQSGLQRALEVRSHFDCPVHALAPPPPFWSFDQRTQVPNAFADLIEAGIAPPSVRRKLYSVLCDAMRKAYLEHGIEFVAAPPSSQDEKSFLLRSLWDKDPTHGNAAYGRCVLEHLREELNV
ncbi:hypothetical protein [Croceibacterium ferulae]|uniref:hypothetical protein n=1 Tax=Croceibacterium ferulae TaxID=1854641 RepID=UPI000F87E1E4|nr:hypothetical protein [Croceibacterium ferulae]